MESELDCQTESHQSDANVWQNAAGIAYDLKSGLRFRSGIKSCLKEGVSL
jgi:hypothetical protein